MSDLSAKRSAERFGDNWDGEVIPALHVRKSGTSGGTDANRLPTGQDPRVSTAANPLWVGLVDVSFDDGPDEDGMVGAFVWTVCEAGSSEEFELRITTEVKRRGASVNEFSDVEPLAARQQRERLSRSLKRLEQHARTRGVALGTWHTYPENED